MKRYYVLVGFFLCLATQGFSQKSFSDYSYIIVSEQFEFQKEKDKYQLNSLVKFLFNKYGFHAYFEKELPRHLDPCDGLWADAEGTPGFIITILEVVIKDCNGVELFRSNKGKSKVKDYKKAYYESMREAFVSIKNLNVDQIEIAIIEDEINVENVKAETSDPIKVAAVPVISTKVIGEKPIEKQSISLKENNKENLPTAKFSNYSFGDKTFLLRKTKKGYSLYEDSEQNPLNSNINNGLILIGTLIIEEKYIKYMDVKDGDFLDAHFDSLKNLIIENGATPIIYKLEN